MQKIRPPEGGLCSIERERTERYCGHCAPAIIGAPPVFGVVMPRSRSHARQSSIIEASSCGDDSPLLSSGMKPIIARGESPVSKFAKIAGAAIIAPMHHAARQRPIRPVFSISYSIGLSPKRLDAGSECNMLEEGRRYLSFGLECSNSIPQYRANSECNQYYCKPTKPFCTPRL